MDKKLQDGKRRLTLSRIGSIQNFTNKTISDNKGDPEKMAGEIWAILEYYYSTSEYPQKSECPKGEKAGVHFRVIFRLRKEQTNWLNGH